MQEGDEPKYTIDEILAVINRDPDFDGPMPDELRERSEKVPVETVARAGARAARLSLIRKFSNLRARIESAPVPPSHSEQQWVSVEDRKPEEDVDVLFCGRVGDAPAGEVWFAVGRNVAGCFYEFTDEDTQPLDYATHWMPLPAAPEPKEPR